VGYKTRPSNGVPNRVVNTKSWSSQSPAFFILSSSCDVWRHRKEWSASLGILILRRLFDVFGALKLNPSPIAVESVRRTWRIPASMSISSHIRPRISPCVSEGKFCELLRHIGLLRSSA
jgi:hypothetical protein